MASTRELRRRIKSVRSTRQITKAMELVASAKMRRASQATVASRPFASKITSIVHGLGMHHPLFAVRQVEKELIIVISSDRGLAGSYNANLLKKVALYNSFEAHLPDFITIGKKAEQLLSKTQANVIQSYPHTPLHPTTQDILPLARFAIQAFLTGTYDKVSVFYTEFHSMLEQEALQLQLLPIPFEEKTTNDFYTYEPSPSTVLDSLLPRLVEVELYQALQESLASEHSARRLAMKSATDNASDMISDLTLTYNSLRQSGITREIAEITSGAAALEG